MKLTANKQLAGWIGTENFDIVKFLAEEYRKHSLGGTERHPSKLYPFLADEFHPLWHTFAESNGQYYLKVEIREFNTELNQLEGCDFIWFNVIPHKNYIEAVCQLNSTIKFNLLGTHLSNATQQ